ncbi:MAG TPA: hypothetical protein VGV12_00750 [Gemmatimonadales bacterium]|nr:hypothetical protein [Gemmatimonadales bacterium]
MQPFPEFDLLQQQARDRFGREPRTPDEQADALGRCDPALVGRVAASLEIRKALNRPRLDFEAFGGNRGRAMGAVSLAGGDVDDIDEAALDRVSKVLGELTGKALETTRLSTEGARADLRRGSRPLAKRQAGSHAERFRAELAEVLELIDRPVDY